MTTTIYIGITTWSCVVYFYSDLNVVSLFSCATKQTLFSWPPPLPPWLLKERGDRRCGLYIKVTSLLQQCPLMDIYLF